MKIRTVISVDMEIAPETMEILNSNPENRKDYLDAITEDMTSVIKNNIIAKLGFSVRGKTAIIKEDGNEIYELRRDINEN